MQSFHETIANTLNGNYPLHTCFDVEEAKLLVSQGIDVNAINDLGQAPLHSLLRSGKPESLPVIQYLISLEIVDVNISETSAETAGTTIAHLCEWGPIMSALVNRPDFEPNKIRACDGKTPLMYGITYPKHIDIIIKLLMDERVDYSIRNPVTGKTALQIAKEHNFNEAEEILKLKINDRCISKEIAKDNAYSKQQPLIFSSASASTVDKICETRCKCTIT